MLADLEKAVQQASSQPSRSSKPPAKDISNSHESTRARAGMRLQLVLEEAEHASRAIKELANDLSSATRTPCSSGKETKP
jgi:hypothetical protein